MSTLKPIAAKARAAAAGLCCLTLLFAAGCKFDHSGIKMPEFRFVTTENLHGIAFVDTGHAWICGNHGTILHSTDGGANWQEQTSGIKEQLLCSIDFGDIAHGWAAGVGGTVVHTADQGKTWIAQDTGTDRNLLDLFVLDRKKAWAVGEFGVIVHTADGGRTWMQQIEEQDTIYNDVFFANARTGWVVGEFGTILHTTDGGETWSAQECKGIEPEPTKTGWQRPLPALYGTCFTDTLNGWIVGMDGVVIHTANGGTDWRRLPAATDKPLYSIVCPGDRGWIVGNKGAYLTTAFPEKTWAVDEEAIKTKFWLREADFADPLHGIIVGARGTIARTENGAESWELISGLSYEMEEYGLADF